MDSVSFENDKRPIPVIIDERAAETPNRIYAILPKTHDIEDGYRETTYAQVARAVNKLSWWLDEQLGKHIADDKEFETIAYTGPRDLRYALICVASIKTHRQVLLPLSQNSFEAQLNLVNLTKPKALIGAPSTMGIWKKVEEVKPGTKLITIPEADDLLYGEEVVAHYHYEKTFEEALNDPIHICHTSGTTGLPKPVPFTTSLCFHFNDLSMNMKPGELMTWDMFRNRKMLQPMVPEWIGGLVGILHFPAYHNMIPIMLPVNAPHPLTPEYMDRVHQIAPKDVDGALYVPDLLKQLVKNLEYIENMKHLKIILYGGAPLEKRVGDTLQKHICSVHPVIGSTDTGGWPILSSDPVDWDYYRISLDRPCELRLEHYQDDLYELVIVRVPGKEPYQIVFTLEPDIDVFHTKDLVRQHPTKKSLWKFSGRTDDFVKLANLTKFNANNVELLLDRHPLVRDAIMGGEGRRRPFVLIHLSEESAKEKGEETILEELWPALQEINKHIANDVQLSKELVLFAKPEKPFRKTGKGSINRRDTLFDYEEEIMQLYERVDEPWVEAKGFGG